MDPPTRQHFHNHKMSCKTKYGVCLSGFDHLDVRVFANRCEMADVVPFCERTPSGRIAGKVLVLIDGCLRPVHFFGVGGDVHIGSMLDGDDDKIGRQLCLSVHQPCVRIGSDVLAFVVGRTVQCSKAFRRSVDYDRHTRFKPRVKRHV